MKYGKRANHVRYIKQVTDSKGRIKKSSRAVGKDYYHFKVGYDINYYVKANNLLAKHLAIRNLIIVVLIVLLIMWR